MKKIFASLILAFYLIFPVQSSAHMAGQPPYFKANGVFSDLYPVPAVSLPDFRLPQDIVKEPILVNESINFEIDVNALPVPQEVVQKTKFTWDFGDGSPKVEGLSNSHTYTKIGTYFLDVYVDTGDGLEPQLLQSTAINIVPDKNYQLPKAVIEINGKQAKDPLLDIIDVNFSDYIEFNGSKSTPGSSQISGYQWDLGDYNSRNEVTFKYQYKDNPYTVFPVLRVKTRDGFIADSFIQIKDEKAFSESEVKPIIPIPGIENGSTANFFVIGLAGIAILLAVVILFILAKLLKK